MPVDGPRRLAKVSLPDGSELGIDESLKRGYEQLSAQMGQCTVRYCDDIGVVTVSSQNVY